MRRRPSRSTAANAASTVAVATLALALGPGFAAAHGAPASRFDAPLPLWLLLTGAGATVAATAALLAVGDRRPSSGGAGERRPGAASVSGDRQSAPWSGDATVGSWSISRRTASVARAALAGGFLLVVTGIFLAGFGGRQVAAENFATVVTWPLWFHGLAFLAILAGNPWPALSPWRTAYRGLVRLEGRPIAVREAVPAWLAHWPAVVGFVAVFGIVENLTVVPRSPRLTAVLIAGLAMAMVAGSVLFGATWFRRADPLGVLFGLFGRVSPITTATGDDEGIDGQRRGGKVRDGGEMNGEWIDVSLRPPWRGCERPVADGSLVVFAIAMVYTVSFDGASDLRAFQTVLFLVRDALGTGEGTSALLYVAGLVGFVALFALVVRLVERLGTSAAGGGRQTTARVGDGGRPATVRAGDGDWRAAARAFAPTVLPIAAAYEVAHAYPYVIGNLGQAPAVALDHVGIAVGAVSPLAWLSLPAFWASQVGLIVLGHVVAVIAAHRVARRRFSSPRAAMVGHLPLVVLMVGYTVLSLWIVSAPVVA